MNLIIHILGDLITPEGVRGKAMRIRIHVENLDDEKTSSNIALPVQILGLENLSITIIANDSLIFSAM